MREWYYRCMSEVVGPLTATELRQQAAAGRIEPDTLIRKGADGRWVQAHSVRGLLPPPADERPTPPSTIPPPIPPPRRSTDTSGHRLGVPKRLIGPLAVAVAAVFIVVLLGLHFLRPLSREEVIARCELCVGHIRGNLSQGTGFMVAPTLMATNRHVVSLEPDTQLSVTFPSSEGGKSTLHTARVIFEAPDVDLAILELDGDFPHLQIASRAQLTRGEEVTVIGNPAVGDDIVLDNAVSRGIVSTTTQIDGMEYCQLDISINPGNSGGPVLDSSGRVIGVVTLKASEEEGLGFCIPLSQLAETMKVVNELGEDERKKNSSLHNLRAATVLISSMGEIYKLAMSMYADSMSRSIDRGRSADQGLSAVQPIVDDLISKFDNDVLVKIESEASRVGADANIPDSIRQKFVDAWTNYRELRSYVEEPRGSLVSYTAKYHELSDNHDRLIESLRLLAGIRD